MTIRTDRPIDPANRKEFRNIRFTQLFAVAALPGPADVRALDVGSDRGYQAAIRIYGGGMVGQRVFPQDYEPVDPVIQNLDANTIIEIGFRPGFLYGEGIRVPPLFQWTRQGVFPLTAAGSGSIDVDDRVGRLLGIVTSITTPVVVDSINNPIVVDSITTPVNISDAAGRLLGIVSSITAAVNVSDRVGRLLGIVDSITNPVNVSDRAARLLGIVASITAPVDVSDRAARLLGVVASITAAVDISDRAARLLGIVYGSVGQITQKAASVLALATDTSVVVQASPMDPQAAVLGVTATAAVNTGSTATLPAPAAGLFHYIISIELVKLYSVIGVAAGAGVIITSTNLPGNPAWTTEQLALAAGSAVKVIKEEPAKPIKCSAAATATTFIAPAQLQTIWRWNIRYYTAP